MNEKLIPQFLLAAPASGSGKTSIAMGLMKLFADKGYQVQPFKCGPDYIDTKFHGLATGKPSINLDTFMASDTHLKELYARYSHTADMCIVEGMMGMYDGYERDKGSSADIARLLDIPVVLVIDARSCAYSVAALLYGFTTFSPEIQVAGVIFNRVGSDKHASMLREACRDIGVECFGCISRNEELRMESRDLGLDITPKENMEIINAWAEFVGKQVNTELLLSKTLRPGPLYVSPINPPAKKKLRIAVARNNESFTFIYQETLDKLSELGKVLFFNPETYKHLPKNIDLLYLPGGYPENRTDELEEMIYDHAADDIRFYARNGGRILAECGGMIFLGSGIHEDYNYKAKMLNIFDFSVTNKEKYRRLTLGYRQFEYNGQKLRGHEFHYTQFHPDEELPESITQVYNAKGEPVDTPVFRYKNVIASYTHLYLGETDILKLWED